MIQEFLIKIVDSEKQLINEIKNIKGYDKKYSIIIGKRKLSQSDKEHL